MSRRGRQNRRHRESRAAEAATNRFPGLSTTKKIAFSLLATGLFFVLLELVLAGAGTRPILFEEDPYVGFSSYVPLFVEKSADDGQAYMVTAENKLNWFNEQRFRKEKPAGAYRVFCAGGSTTYGRPYSDVTSFCGWLRELLPVADDARQWEVINAGGISYASYRVAMLMEELVRYEPDLFIIYSGHNEFLEDRTYRSIIRLPSALRGLGGLLSRTRTFTVLKRLADHRSPDSPVEESARELLPSEVATRLDKGVGPDAYSRDDQLQQHVLAHYRYNLTRMVDIARSIGAKVILVTPASNLRDCSPFKSQHGAEVEETDRQRWQSLVDHAQQLRDAGQLVESLKALNEAAAIDGRHARLHYLRGQVLTGLGRHDEAKTAFVRARDEDVCPLRALTPMRQTVAEVAADRDVPMVDFVSVVEARCEHNTADGQLFLDHVHPTIEGNRLLSLALLDELIALRIVTPTETWNDDAIARVIRKVEGGLDRRAHALALRNLAKVLNWAGKVDEANKLALRALEMGSSDVDSYYLAANALAEQGDLDQAVEKYKQALQVSPDYVQAHNALGAAYHRLNKLELAEQEYREAIRLDPEFAPAYSNLGALYQRQGKLVDAAAQFQEAIRINPNYSGAYNNLGMVLRTQLKLDEAAAKFRAAIRINPQLAEAYYNLGDVLARQGDYPGAANQFEEAIRVEPDYAPAHAGLGLLRSNEGKLHDAVLHLRAALKQPRPPLAAANSLAWILATSDDGTLRDGREAVRWAEYCATATSYRQPGILNTLAAAHAEAGNFTEAARWQSMALELAPERLKPECRQRLKLYHAGKPYRQSPKP